MFSRHEFKKWKEKSRTDLGYLTVRKTESGEISSGGRCPRWNIKGMEAFLKPVLKVSGQGEGGREQQEMVLKNQSRPSLSMFKCRKVTSK